MRVVNLVKQHQRLVWLIRQADNLSSEQIEMRAHWACYICVLASGFLENALKEVYSGYARVSSSPSVADFVESTLAKVQNPRASRFVEIARSFNRQWAADLEVHLAQDGRKEAIDAIMSNRNLIAHGKDSGMSLARVADYLAKSVVVVEFIEGQCKIK